MESIVVAVDPVVDVETVELAVARLNNADRMERAVNECHILHAQVRTSVKEQVVGPLCASSSRRRWRAAFRTMELQTLAVDRPRTFDRKVVGINGEEQRHVAIRQRRIAR